MEKLLRDLSSTGGKRQRLVLVLAKLSKSYQASGVYGLPPAVLSELRHKQDVVWYTSILRMLIRCRYLRRTAGWEIRTLALISTEIFPADSTTGLSGVSIEDLLFQIPPSLKLCSSQTIWFSHAKVGEFQFLKSGNESDLPPRIFVTCLRVENGHQKGPLQTKDLARNSSHGIDSYTSL
ncbi:hypothetical protein RRG08_041853 [Elysia crispata]|uniref:Uncharacterized protein n=1 Tax=Elysia crispata TaxID=231223 RepID=A0AAE1CQN0_9GAST|nr:hypothetical protein RRG08_041853 [Elysia crispata]